MVCICIKNSNFALLKQKRLTAKIICKILVLIWTDMVRLDIGKNTNIKLKTCCSVKHQTLRRNLHNHAVAACLYHFCKVFLNQIRLRCGIGRRNFLLADNGFNGSDKSCFMTGIFQNGLYKIGCGCFSFCSRNSYGL